MMANKKPQISWWVYLLITVLTIFIIVGNPVSILIIWIPFLAANYCSKDAAQMDKSSNLAYIMGFLFAIPAAIYYAIAWNYYTKHHSIKTSANTKTKLSSKSKFSIITGIFSIFLTWIPGFGIIPIVLGILGIIEWYKKDIRGLNHSIWGIALGIISLCLSIFIYSS